MNLPGRDLLKVTLSEKSKSAFLSDFLIDSEFGISRAMPNPKLLNIVICGADNISYYLSSTTY